MADEPPIIAKLIVMDTAPLITLAAAQSLDYLTYPNAPVYIPDAVLHEATINSAALGAQPIAEWVEANSEAVGGLVHVITTTTYANFLILKDLNPAHHQRDLGEAAALEAIRDGISLAANERAVLVTEDRRAVSGVLVLPADQERIIPITTRDLLLGLEAAGRINSADAVYAQALAVGRAASTSEVLPALDQQARDAVTRLLRQRPSNPSNGS